LRIKRKTAAATVAVVAASLLAACGGGAQGDGAARREPAQPSAGTVLGEAAAQPTAMARAARATHRRPAALRPTRGHAIEITLPKAATRRPVRTLLRTLLAEPHRHSRPAPRGQSLLARILKQRPGAAPPSGAPSKTAPGQDVLSSITKQLHKQK
jgi:hypothetical protein